jgi:hypothetical protein
MTWVLVLTLTSAASQPPVPGAPVPRYMTVPGYATQGGCQRAGVEAVWVATNHSVRDFFCIPGLHVGAKQARSGP